MPLDFPALLLLQEPGCAFNEEGNIP